MGMVQFIDKHGKLSKLFKSVKVYTRYYYYITSFLCCKMGSKVKIFIYIVFLMCMCIL